MPTRWTPPRLRPPAPPPLPERAACPLPPHGRPGTPTPPRPAPVFLPLPLGEGRGEGASHRHLRSCSLAFLPLPLGEGRGEGSPPHAPALLLALALTLPPVTALAQQPDPSSAPACDAPALLAEPADALAEHLPRCEKNPAYLLRLGQLRNQQRQYEQAADHLERALMLAPDRPEALLQYAIALAGSGDTLSALNLMAELRQRPDLPEPLRASLQGLLAAWTQRLQPAAPGPLWARGSSQPGAPAQSTTLAAGLRLGWDSNLQGASRLSELTLTLPGQSITLPIEPDQQPRAGAVAQADLRASHQRLLAGGARWGLQGAVQQRHTPVLEQLSSSQAEWQFDYTAAPVWRRPAAIKSEAPGAAGDAAAWAPWLATGMAALRTPGGTRYLGRSLSLGLERTSPGASPLGDDCAARWALDTQQRSLYSNPILSSHYLGTSLQWQCTRPGAGRQWLAALRAGRDHARDPARPGGDQAQAGLRLHWAAPAPGVPGLARLLAPSAGAAPRPAGARGTIDADYAYSRDTRGYSPLLDDGRIRHLHRLTLRLEWQQPLAGGLQAVLGAESVAQDASLPLFRMRSHGVWLGLRGQW